MALQPPQRIACEINSFSLFKNSPLRKFTTKYFTSSRKLLLAISSCPHRCQRTGPMPHAAPLPSVLEKDCFGLNSQRSLYIASAAPNANCCIRYSLAVNPFATAAKHLGLILPRATEAPGRDHDIVLDASSLHTMFTLPLMLSFLFWNYPCFRAQRNIRNPLPKQSAKAAAENSGGSDEVTALACKVSKKCISVPHQCGFALLHVE